MLELPPLKIIKVNACKECPHLLKYFRDDSDCCELHPKLKAVDDIESYPGWCPLPDMPGE